MFFVCFFFLSKWYNYTLFDGILKFKNYFIIPNQKNSILNIYYIIILFIIIDVMKRIINFKHNEKNFLQLAFIKMKS